MRDLKDGESVEMRGSGARPYVLKNIAGVYSCSCPAWRNQSLPIERRSCKHLRRLRGDAAEAERLGMAVPSSASEDMHKPNAPPLLLAESWDGSINPAGWLLSEKLDGVRAYFDGKRLLSRRGNVYHAPGWFLQGLPDMPLDGELWLARKQFQRTVSIVRRHDECDLWKEIAFLIFDVPGLDGGFEERLRFLNERFPEASHPHACVHGHVVCRGSAHLEEELKRVECLGGEGLMLRQPGSHYEIGRSATLLKVKSFQEADARVVAHLPGLGRHRGRLGALLLETGDGVTFAVGTGFTDAEREQPPPIGSVVTFRYQELTPGGVPRFSSFVRVRHDLQTSSPLKGESPMSAPSTSRTRRFEFAEGSSSKFWEITQLGIEVTVSFGRIGTQGQSQTRSFNDNVQAERHAERLIKQKLAKGYGEVK